MTDDVIDEATLGLTSQQVELFKKNGFAGPFDLYSEEDALLIWNQALIEMVTSRTKPHNSTIINYDRHLDCNTLSKHISHPAIVHKLRSLIGDDVICWKTNIFEKQPGESGTGWHQVETHMLYASETSAYPSLKYTEETDKPARELTVWTAFSPASKENGCMRFIPGSHEKWFYDETRPLAHNVQSRSHDFFGYNYSELQLDKNWDPNKSEIVDMEMKPGQFVIFTSKCIHGSQPNTSEVKRLGYASRYVPPSVKIYEDVDRLSGYGDAIDLDYYGAVLVSGKDRFKYNRLHQTNLNGFPFETVETDGR